jgi:hypothetical protein
MSWQTSVTALTRAGSPTGSQRIAATRGHSRTLAQTTLDGLDAVYGGLRSECVVLELDLNITAGEALDECRRRGLVVRSERELAGCADSHHWHLGFPHRAGTLELNEWQNRVWVKVHLQRDGGWADALAHELRSLARNSAPA